ncbi:MAG: SIS domain-containing protein [Treponema sp.]|jgi:D-arabinose 5-phosphate isomerase GutQ|nr:SIS domain-containing protein [Treponema sp.]
MRKKTAEEGAFERARLMWEKDARVLSRLCRIVRPEDYEAALGAILACGGRVVTMGMGTSGVAARKIAHMLCVANIPSYFVSAGDAAHGAFGSVQKEDLLIMISRGGGTEELVNLLEPVREKGVTLITVTQNPDSPLARASSLLLLLDTEEADHRGVLPTASILAVIAFFDAVADELSRRPRFSKKDFYHNHNHGAVGAWLKEELEKEKEQKQP